MLPVRKTKKNLKSLKFDYWTTQVLVDTILYVTILSDTLMKNIFLLALVSLFSCTNPNSESSLQDDKVTSFRELEKTSWLIGEWASHSDGARISEVWKKVSDSVYQGKSYFIRGSDTVSSESISLIQRENTLYYIPVVKNQNEGQAVSFKLSVLDSTKFVFENPDHDFPQKIMYQQLSHDSLMAEISGTVKGEHRSERFPMKKVQH